MKLRIRYKKLKRELKTLENITISNNYISSNNLILIETDNLSMNVIDSLYEVLKGLKKMYKNKNFIIATKNLLEIRNLSKEEYDFLNNIINKKK